MTHRCIGGSDGFIFVITTTSKTTKVELSAGSMTWTFRPKKRTMEALKAMINSLGAQAFLDYWRTNGIRITETGGRKYDR